MKKEQYVPSSEEVKKAEGMMTEKEKIMSEERNATFIAGQEKGQGDILDLSRKDIDVKKREKQVQNLKELAPETYEFLKNKLSEAEFDYQLMRYGNFFVSSEIGKSAEFDKIINDLSLANIEINSFGFSELFDADDLKSDIDNIAEKYPKSEIRLGLMGLSYKTRKELIDYIYKSNLRYSDL